MLRILSFCFLLSIPFFLQAQLNVSLTAHVNYVEEDKGNGNDIWGYVAPDGTEYAIVGTTEGTLVYSLEDPANPIERIFIEGSTSTWRDMKQWGEYAYVTTDSGTDGLLVIDMSGAPENIEFVFRKPILPGSNGDITLERCHNIYIDENGILYLAGCHGRGADFFDTTDPWDPQLIGSIEAPYFHDAYAKGDTLYASRIFNGDLALYDVSDKTAPELMGSVNTSSDFTHNAWGDPTNNFAFTTDERPEGFVDAYDISDPGNIEFLDKIMVPGTEGTGTIPHNTHYLDGYLVTSWYTSGLVVVDANKPDNLVMVAQYDTYDGADGGFSGCWGTTPYLPSGIVLANDINSGFYVFDVDYKRACYLEGTVTDASSGAVIHDVEINLIDGQFIEDTRTNILGKYSYGQEEAGIFDVEFSHPLYENQILQATLVNGEVTILDAELIAKPMYTLDFTVVDEATGVPIPASEIELFNEGIVYAFKTDENGAAVGSVVEGDYNIYIGKWGYENIGSINDIINSNQSLTFELSEAYMDDFALDLGWSVENEALGNFTGAWERGIPNGTINNGSFLNPNVDVDGDLGNKCYVTGNDPQAGPFSDDVDNGITQLISPAMDLTNYINPSIEFSLWFINAGGNGTPNDALEISITNGVDTVLLEIYNNPLSEQIWVAFDIPLDGVLTITDKMQLIATTSDLPGEGHIVEAGFDQFFVNGAPIHTENISAQTLDIFPNPATSEIQLSHNELAIESVKLFNSVGQLVLAKDNIKLQNISLNVENLPTGSYVVLTKLNDQTSIIKKVQVIR